MVMGLSFRPGHASWSYTGYSRFRHKLAELEGITLDDMYGFGGKKQWDDTSTLEPLLNSPDNYGFLGGWACEQMLPRLKAIVEFNADHFDDYDLCQLKALIEGMEHCAQHGCALNWS